MFPSDIVRVTAAGWGEGKQYYSHGVQWHELTSVLLSLLLRRARITTAAQHSPAQCCHFLTYWRDAQVRAERHTHGLLRSTANDSSSKGLLRCWQ
jgi:hypothetical protein